MAAVTILSWIAIVVLYLALSAVLREVKLLRRQVTQLSARADVVPAGAGVADAVGATQPAGPGITDASDPAPAPDPARPDSGLRLPQVVQDSAGAIVVAATSTCPLCRVVLEHLAAWARRYDAPAVLLTYETPSAWWRLPEGIRVVCDEAAWSEIAHISPPLVLAVDGRGRVLDLVLPATVADVDQALATWGLTPAPPSTESDSVPREPFRVKEETS